VRAAANGSAAPVGYLLTRMDVSGGRAASSYSEMQTSRTRRTDQLGAWLLLVAVLGGIVALDLAPF
jgi:hypothetical protein